MQIGADEKSRLAVQQFGADPQTIAERFDHHQQKRQIGPGFAPINGAVDFDGNLSRGAGGEATDFHYRDGIILEDLLRSRCRRAIEAWAAGSAVAFGQRQAQPGILANAPDEGGPRRQPAQHGFIGIATVAAHNQLPLSSFGHARPDSAARWSWQPDRPTEELVVSSPFCMLRAFPAGHSFSVLPRAERSRNAPARRGPRPALRPD